jgi:hypothetical protein
MVEPRQFARVVSCHVVTHLNAMVDVSAVDRIIILAGKDDCEPLYWRCAGQTARKFERPLAGLGIGQQLQWLTQRVA